MFKGSRKLTTMAMIFLTAAVAVAAEPFEITFDRLAKVEHFAFGGTGYAGRISQGEKDFRSILYRSSAAADFERLYKTGNLQAKCYALAGLRTLSPEKYNELAKPLRASTEKVETIHGCIISKEPVAEVIREIDAGYYQ